MTHREQTRRIESDEAKPLRVTGSAGWDTEGGARGSLSVTHDNVGGWVRSIGVQGYSSGIRRLFQIAARDPERREPGQAEALGPREEGLDEGGPRRAAVAVGPSGQERAQARVLVEGGVGAIEFAGRRGIGDVVAEVGLQALAAPAP